MDRKAQTKPGAEPSRRTPVKAAGGGVPWAPIAGVAAAIAVVLMIVYLVAQAGGEAGLPAHDRAAQDDSPNLPGVFFPSQGAAHTGAYSPAATPFPFCDGVEWSGMDDPAANGNGDGDNGDNGDNGDAANGGDNGDDADAGGQTPDDATVDPEATALPTDCYLSNPPSSGPHLGVSRGVQVGGYVINVPPDPNVYPHDLDIPRDSIPHLLEHAGVYVGWNCADGDDACMEVIEELEGLVNNRIDNHDDRVVMAWDSDIPEGQIGLAGWTRVDRFHYEEYERSRADDFIRVHSCRFDPERFCR
jgi:hypothetical protein